MMPVSLVNWGRILSIASKCGCAGMLNTTVWPAYLAYRFCAMAPLNGRPAPNTVMALLFTKSRLFMGVSLGWEVKSQIA
ncbi:hypothetical protein FQZ97_1058040 [compost metagenome]